MSSVPVVSIVLPTYKRMDLLPGAIESALEQSYQCHEIVVSDNASSEEVEELVRSYGDRRLRYRHNDGNVGPLRNVLAACADARGELVALLHDDDAWEPHFLETLVPPLLADDKLSLAFSDHFLMDPAGNVDLRRTNANTMIWHRSNLLPGVHQPFTRLAVLERAVPVAMAAVLRKSAIDWDDIPDEVGSAYDLWLAYLAARDGAGAYFCEDRLTRHRSHEQSLTSRSRNDRACVFVYGQMISDPRLANLREDLMRRAAAFETGLGVSLLWTGELTEARRHLMAGMKGGAKGRAVGGLVLSVLPKPHITSRFASRTRRRLSGGDVRSRPNGLNPL